MSKEVGLRPDYNKSEYAKRLNRTWWNYANGAEERVQLSPSGERGKYNVRQIGNAVHAGVNKFFRRPDAHNSTGSRIVDIPEAVANTANLISYFAQFPFDNSDPGKQYAAYVSTEVRLKHPAHDREIRNFYSRDIFKQRLLGIVGNLIIRPEGMLEMQKPLLARLHQQLGQLHEHLIPFEVKYDPEGNPILYEPTAIADVISLTDLTGKNKDLCEGCRELFNSTSMHNIQEVRTFRQPRRFSQDPDGIALLRKLFDKVRTREVFLQIGEIKTVHGAMAAYMDQHPEGLYLSEAYLYDISHTAMAFRELTDIACYGTRNNPAQLWEEVLPNLGIRLFYQPMVEENGVVRAGNACSIGIKPDVINETMDNITAMVTARPEHMI